MILVLKPGAEQARLDALLEMLRSRGVSVSCSRGESTLLLLSGGADLPEARDLTQWEIVEEVRDTPPSRRLSDRWTHPVDTVIQVGTVCFGNGSFPLIAGPCAVESEDQIVSIARAVKAAGADALRGGAFKPRTSPYSFRGLGAEGLEYLKTARAETGLPIVSEIMDPSQLPLFRDIDVLQIGARNMQNYALLEAVSHQDKPVLLKRGLSATYEEWLMSAEYILAGGNSQVILCERGIRSFDPSVRSTLDLTAIPMLRRLTHLPVLADPSHAVGDRLLVPSMACAAAAAGADGLLLEVHDDPLHALCDGAQALTPEAFAALAQKLRGIRSVLV